MVLNMTSNNISSCHVLLVGHIIPNSREKTILNQAIPPTQTQRFGKALQHSLQTAFNTNVDVLSVAPLLDYPSCNIIFAPCGRWKTGYFNSSATMMPYINVFGIKHITRFMGTFIFTIIWSLLHLRKRRIIVMHGCQSCKLLGVLLGSIFLPAIRISFLTDNIGLSLTWEGKIKRAFRKIDTKIMRFALKRVSLSIGMTTKLIKLLMPNKPSLLMPAILPKSLLNRKLINSESQKYRILYSGGLDENFGVHLLLNAFKLSRHRHWRLIITGKGALSNEINRMQQQDQRISYKGLVSFAELENIYACADVFVNPRSSKDLETHYLFPSKLIEQMATGAPVVSSNLPCLTNKIRKHLFILEKEDPERLLSLLSQIDKIGKRKRQSFGRIARSFVVEEFSPSSQGKRIRSFVFNNLP